MELTNILVAIDFSEQSRVALQQAIAVARRCDARLTLLWVEGESSRAPSGAAMYSTAAREVERLIADVRAASLARLEALADQAREQGVDAAVRIESGSPAEVIVAAADDVGASLVVTGTKGLTGFKRFFLGSVATKVVRTSRTSVLVARGEVETFTRILVPTDFSPASEKALRLALTLAAPGAEISLFHAWQYPSGTMGVSTPNPTEGPLLALRNEIVQRTSSQGQAWIERYAREGVSMRLIHEHGAAAAVIQEKLEAEPYDLVALGTQGYRGVQRFLLGSVAEATVRYSPCPVVVVHAGSPDPA